ncbi:sarcoplasmic calcium-binding proteins I, III, and IV-like isoform X4 [Branchiostoma floridae]|uniref:Sarcoplasmic calcium-binding proteins I, III, and IV-like isoform X4 n=1 Tax=Branchiostoma floridae TaxID=7739 RepID=A0A9J7HLY6_BRAFL|nr:sarcoplasmic calcium-binding proteins I, III, and IV-like isoform X4 [Branchiostoma floridae]
MELNTFQKQKIKFTFDFFLDYNKDGAIQWDDFQEMIKRYKDVNKGSLSDADYKLMLASLEDEWKDLKALAHANEDHPVHANEDHGARVYANEDHGARVYANEDHGARVHANEDHGASVSFDAYLAMWEKTLATCKSVSDLPTWCQKMIPILFKGMDVSGDGIVDLEEFGNYCKNFQLDCEDVPAVYDVITDGGKVTFDMNRYKELYFRLLTSPSADAGNALMGKKP